MNQIGQRMKSLREEHHLSQAEIAKLCGSNQATIAKMETGKTAPSVKILVWLADYFHVSMDYLCCRTDQPQGKRYEYQPPVQASGADMKRFIEMCFDPNSKFSSKLKEALLQMAEGEKK